MVRLITPISLTQSQRTQLTLVCVGKAKLRLFLNFQFYLKILKQQQRLSSAYPAHKAQLTLEYLRLQDVLGQLLQRRQEFLQTPLAA